MKKFLVLYKAPVEEFSKAMIASTPEAMEESMAKWGAWMEKHNDHLVEGGAPIGKTKLVTPTTTSDIKNEIGGYSIVQAKSHDEATKILVDSPHFETMNGATIEVMEIIELPAS